MVQASWWCVTNKRVLVGRMRTLVKPCSFSMCHTDWVSAPVFGKYPKLKKKRQCKRICSSAAHEMWTDAFSLCLEFLQGQVSSYQGSIRGPGTNAVGLDQQSPLQSILHSFDFSRFYRAINYNDHLMTYDSGMIVEKNPRFRHSHHPPHYEERPLLVFAGNGKQKRVSPQMLLVPLTHRGDVSRENGRELAVECWEDKHRFHQPRLISPSVSFINHHKQNAFTNK